MSQRRACGSIRVVALLAALCGAILVSPVRAQQDPRRAAPPPGRALVCIFRSDVQPVPPDVGVVVNAERVGRLANGTFLVTTVPPGKTYLHVGDGIDTPAQFEAEAGHTYFIRGTGDPGLRDADTRVDLVSEAEGRSALADSRLAEAAPPPQPSVAGPAPARSRGTTTAAATGPREPAPADAGRDWSIAVIPKAGSFKLQSLHQTIGDDVVTYDAKSKSVYGLDVEWRSASGFAAGGEFFEYRNRLASDITAFTGQQQVFVYMVNAKYYFRAASWFYPYVGVGAGGAVTKFTGDIIVGNSAGAAYQGLAGMEFRFGRVGLYLQYKALNARTTAQTEDANGNTIDVTVKAGGKGVFGGISVIF